MLNMLQLVFLSSCLMISFFSLNAKSQDLKYQNFLPNKQISLEKMETLHDEVRVRKVVLEGIPYGIVETTHGRVVIMDFYGVDEKALERSLCLTGSLEQKDLTRLESTEWDFRSNRKFHFYSTLAVKNIKKKCDDRSIGGEGDQRRISVKSWLVGELHIGVSIKNKKGNEYRIFNRNLKPNLNFEMDF